MPPAPKNRRVRRLPGPHHRRFRSAEEMQRDAGDLSVYEGPDWPPFVIIPQGPDNPGAFSSVALRFLPVFVASLLPCSLFNKSASSLAALASASPTLGRLTDSGIGIARLIAGFLTRFEPSGSSSDSSSAPSYGEGVGLASQRRQPGYAIASSPAPPPPQPLSPLHPVHVLSPELPAPLSAMVPAAAETRRGMRSASTPATTTTSSPGSSSSRSRSSCACAASTTSAATGYLWLEGGLHIGRDSGKSVAESRITAFGAVKADEAAELDAGGGGDTDAEAGGAKGAPSGDPDAERGGAKGGVGAEGQWAPRERPAGADVVLVWRD
ncbi:hypothetical protein B0H13DRAFT_2330414 [Mycena leptocephala]|nr:hypothetical protein B0H13DRAFT_2330414 [Mycena leptocephala]